MNNFNEFPQVSPGYIEAPQEVVEQENSREEKSTAVLEQLTNQTEGEIPDVIFCFSGGIKPYAPTGEYRTLGYSDVSELGLLTASRTRVLASAEIAKAAPDIAIVTNSFNRNDLTEPTMAKVNRDELVRLGVDEERIELEEDSFSTISQLTEMIKKAVNNKWRHVAVVSNAYHLPRITEMTNRLPEIVDDPEFQAKFDEFKLNDGRVYFVSAESILRVISDHYTHFLEEAEQSPAYLATVAAEAKGLDDLRSGKYLVARVKDTPDKN